MKALIALAAAANVIYPVAIVYDGMPPPRLRAASEHPIPVVFGHVEECGTPNVPGDPMAVFEACTRNGGIVYLPNPCDYGDSEKFARLVCHEQAHLQGWPKDHGP